MSERKRGIVCIFARDAQGKVLMQMRDSGGGDGKALCWGFFGGHLENDELLLVAAVREFEEETSVVLSEDELELVGEGDYADSHHWLFVVKRPVSWRELDIREGAGAGFFTRAELERIPMMASSLAIVRAFL